MEMPNLSATFSNAAQTSMQWLNEQEWFQPVKGKWDELDPQSRTYLQLSVGGLTAALIGYLIFSFVWSVHSLRREVSDKSEMLSQIQTANDEIKRLHGVSSNLNGAIEGAGVASDPGPWAPYFESFAGQIGITHDSFNVSESKPGTTNELSKEVLYDIAIKKINVHQMVRYAYALENGSRPVKLRNLVINTQPDMSGYLDATLSVSAFVVLNTSASSASGK